MNNVKKTLEYLVDILGENDRLSLVTFESTARRLCGLLRITDDNR